MAVDSDLCADAPPSVASTIPSEADSIGVAEDVTSDAETTAATYRSARRTDRAKRVLAYGIAPGLALMLAIGAGYLKWLDGSARQVRSAAAESVAAATNSAAALLSYRADTVDKDLTAAQGRLTGSFRDAYTQLVQNVVIPGAKQKQISAVATVPAAASVSSSENRAVVLVFVDQTVTIGKDAPTSTASSIRVTLDKIDDRWLISGFEPI